MHDHLNAKEATGYTGGLAAMSSAQKNPASSTVTVSEIDQELYQNTELIEQLNVAFSQLANKLSPILSPASPGNPIDVNLPCNSTVARRLNDSNTQLAQLLASIHALYADIQL